MNQSISLNINFSLNTTDLRGSKFLCMSVSNGESGSEAYTYLINIWPNVQLIGCENN